VGLLVRRYGGYSSDSIAHKMKSALADGKYLAQDFRLFTLAPECNVQQAAY